MYQINDLKVGVTFEMDGDLYQVQYSEHSKSGRAGAVMRTKLKNLVTGATLEKTFRGGDKLNPAQLERRDCQYLYEDGSELFFMDNSNYEQFTLSNKDFKNALNYIKDGDSVTIQFFENKPIGVDLPPKVNLKVVEAENAVKGDTQSSANKFIVLETGLKISAPLFIKQNDTVRINTQTGEYVERV